MSLTSIIDSLSKVANKRTGGPDSLTGDNFYDTNTFRYPLDVGSYDKGHYIVFNINVQDKTQFQADEHGVPQAVIDAMQMESVRGGQNIGSLSDKIKENLASGVAQAIKLAESVSNQAVDAAGDYKDKAREALNFASDVAGGVAGELANLDSRFLRKIYRTTDTVAMYMPDQLQFNYAQGYGSPSTSAGPLAGFSAAGQSLYDMVKSGMNTKDVATNMSPFLFNYLSGNKLLGGLGKPLFTAISGVVQNPMIEVLYTSPNLRTFNFTFMFYPRSEAEALEVQMIIDRFRFHQAPEIKMNSGGYFLVPPSEFDIKFMYFGQENPNIDKISTCVLQNISVDYTKAGQWVAYEIEGDNRPTFGGTGMPVGIGMTLQFMETRIVTKESLRMQEMLASSTAGPQQTYGNGQQTNATNTQVNNRPYSDSAAPGNR